MKTLDEVIKAYEICSTQQRCIDGCPYYKNDCPLYEMEQDAFHYLKEYREKLNILTLRMAEYRRGFEQLSAEWSRIKDNPPLTWDELRQMFHKPVWIETTAKKGWNIIVSIDSADMQVIHTSHRGPKLSGFSKASLGKTWQAYRKERE